MPKFALSTGLGIFMNDPFFLKPNENELIAKSGIVNNCNGKDESLEVINLKILAEYVVCYSPRLRNVAAVIQERSARVGQAKASYLPSASLNVSKQHNTANPLSLNSERTNDTQDLMAAVVNMRVFDFGVRAGQQQAAVYALQRSIAEYESIALQSFNESLEIFFNAFAADHVLLYRIRAVERLRSILESTRRMQVHGVAAPIEIEQVLVALSRAELTAKRAQFDRDQLYVRLSNAMGIQPRHFLKISLSNDVEGLKFNNLPAATHFVNAADESHPVLRAGMAAVDAAKALIHSVQGEAKPRLDFAIQYNRSQQASRVTFAQARETTSTSLTLTVPLFDGFAWNYRAMAASAELSQAYARLDNSKQQLVSDIRQAHFRVDVAKSSLSIAKQILDSTTKVLASTARRHELGMVDIVELLNSEVSSIDAHVEQIRAMSALYESHLRLLVISALITPAALMK
jgi:outer membrane protein